MIVLTFKWGDHRPLSLYWSSGCPRAWKEKIKSNLQINKSQKIKKRRGRGKEWGTEMARRLDIKRTQQEKNTGGAIGIEKRTWERNSERTSRDEIYKMARRKRKSRRRKWRKRRGKNFY